MQWKLFLFIIFQHVLESRSQLHREGSPHPLLSKIFNVMSLLSPTALVWCRRWLTHQHQKTVLLKLESRRSYHVWKSFWVLLEKIDLDSWKEKLFPLLWRGACLGAKSRDSAARLPKFKCQLSTSCVTVNKLSNLSVPYHHHLYNENNHRTYLISVVENMKWNNIDKVIKKVSGKQQTL